MKIKLILRYLSNNFLLQLLGIFFSGLTIRMLTLPELGLFNLAKSLASSFQYTHIGFRYALDRTLPEGKIEYNLKSTYITLIINSLVSLILFIVYCIFYNYNIYFILYILGGWVFATFSLIRIYYRGVGLTDYFVRITFTSNLLIIVIPIFGIYLGNIKGLFISYLLITTVILLKYFPSNLYTYKFAWDKIHILKLFKTGFPIFISYIALFISDNLDKFVINHFLGIKSVGEFGIITLAYSSILMLPSLIVELVFPDYIKLKESKSEIRGLLVKHIVTGFLLIISSIIVTYLILPIFINTFFPKYYYLNSEIKMIVFALIPYILISPFYCLLFANDKSVNVSVLNVFCLILYLIFTYYFLANNYNLLYVIYSKIAYVFMYLIGLIILLWKCGLINKYYLEDV